MTEVVWVTSTSVDRDGNSSFHQHQQNATSRAVPTTGGGTGAHVWSGLISLVSWIMKKDPHLRGFSSTYRWTQIKERG